MKPAVKKGFLNDLASKGKTSNIYPDTGSSEGQGGSKGGMSCLNYIYCYLKK